MTKGQITALKLDMMDFAPGMKIITAGDLLDSADLQALKSLKSEMSEVVDYLVLTRSTFFIGSAEDVMGWEVALKRRVEMEAICGWGLGWRYVFFIHV